MKKEKYVVYIHEFPNKKVYIGISNDYKRRWKNGFGYKNSNLIYNAIIKYGWDNIKHIIFKKELKKEEAMELEKHLIKLYKSNNNLFGYNLTSGGEYIYERTEEHKENLRNKSKGNKHSQGRIVSEETRKRMSESAKKRFKGKQQEMLIELHKRPINQYDLDGNFIKRWDSEVDYAKSVGAERKSLIGKCCRKIKGIKQAYGYKWEYAEKEEK